MRYASFGVPLDFDDDDEKTRIGGEIAPSAPARDRPYLVVLSGKDIGQVFKLADGESILGRLGTVKLSEDGVSRRHARVFVDRGSVVIEDLGSANGIYINGSRTGQATLNDGDQIRLGATTILKFSYTDSLEADFQEKMSEAASRDALTRAFNKRHLLERMESEIAFARRHDTPLTLAMLDLDFFKRVNDTYGHLAGDVVLANIARTVQSSIRAEDLLARYGGEEFAVLARGSSAEIEHLASRIRSVVETTEHDVGNAVIVVTVSIGLATCSGKSAKSATDLIAAADRALYEAKHRGRNRVVASIDT